MSEKACIFDLDGVVTDTAHFHFLAWQRLAHSVGVDFGLADNDKLKGVGRMESLDYILAKTSRDYSDSIRQELADKKNNDYKELINSITPDHILPGITAAFDWLKKEGWKIGLASASRNAPQVLRSLAIEDIFDYVADAGQIARGKPAPDIFLDVADAFRLPPNKCLGIEDAAAGVTAIKAAGMRAIGIGDPEVLYEADMILPTPERLVEAITKSF